MARALRISGSLRSSYRRRAKFASSKFGVSRMGQAPDGIGEAGIATAGIGGRPGRVTAGPSPGRPPEGREQDSGRWSPCRSRPG